MIQRKAITTEAQSLTKSYSAMAPEMIADRYSKSCQRTIFWLADDLIVSFFQVDAIQVEMQKDVRKDEVLTFYKIRKDEDLFL